MSDQTAPRRVPAGATSDGDGVVVGHGPVRVDTFIDFLCPYCRRFELSSGTALAGLVADGEISLAYHPMNFLDAASSTNYSTRAAAASGCAADLGRFAEYAHALFVNQPPEGGAGLSDAELAARRSRVAASGVQRLAGPVPPGRAVVRRSERGRSTPVAQIRPAPGAGGRGARLFVTGR